MTARLPRVSWHSGIVIVLTLTLAGLASYSLAQAEWTETIDSHMASIWLGLVFGVVLALTRWHARTAFAYSLGLSLLAAFESIANVVVTPALFGTTARATLEGMNLRAFIGWERVAAWATALAAGGPVADTGLFIALVNLVAWGVMAWLGWWLARRHQPLVAVLPLVALLALNNHLSRQPASGFLSLLACTLLLIATFAFGDTCADWLRRRVDFSDELALEWGASAVAVTLVIGLLAALAPYAATPDGWRAVAQWFEQPAARTAAQLFPGVNPPREVSVAPFAQTPDLSRIGAPIPQSDETVMWVRLSDAPPPPPAAGEAAQAAPPTHYWRNAAFGEYTGTGWRAALGVDSVTVTTSGRYELVQRFDIIAEHGPALFAVNQPVTASAALTPDGMLQGEVASYTVTSLATRVTATELITASTAYPDAITNEYLSLPESLPARVGALAERLTVDAANPYEKAVRIQNYLRANYAYRLDAPPAPAGRDAVDYFLFEAPGGFCSHYASAMVVLLRAVGVPARVVGGFAMGSYDFEQAAWRVPASAAHAWVEVYFPEYGWVEFEPTAAFSPREYPGASDAAPDTQPETQTAQPITFGEVVRLAGFAALLMAAGVWLLRTLFARTSPDAEQVRALYWHIRRALSRAGLNATPSTTPEEFLHAQSAALAPPLRAALSEATYAYERAEYGGQSLTPREVERVQHQWRLARGEWVRLFWKRLMLVSPLSRREMGQG